MQYTWLFIVSLIAVAAIVFLAWYRYRLRSHERDLKRVAVISHTRTIKMLPEYRKAVNRYRILMACAAVSFLASILAFTAVAARPYSTSERDTENESRDIVLCLDVSGSMSRYSTTLLSFFAEIVNGLHGQRIGLTIFDGVPASIIPLTDDYDAIIEVTEELASGFSAYGSAVSGLSFGSSAIGDGVMGCISNLDNGNDDSERSKSIIIATDNYAGSQTVDINQAARYAKRLGVTFYGISIGMPSGVDDILFRTAVATTGGSFYNVNNFNLENSVTGNIINKVLEQEAAKVAGTVETIRTDSPDVMLFVSAACFGLFLILIWRLRL